MTTATIIPAQPHWEVLFVIRSEQGKHCSRHAPILAWIVSLDEPPRPITVAGPWSPSPRSIAFVGEWHEDEEDVTYETTYQLLAGQGLYHADLAKVHPTAKFIGDEALRRAVKAFGARPLAAV